MESALAGCSDPVEHPGVKLREHLNREGIQSARAVALDRTDALSDFYSGVDERARELAGRLEDRLQCRRGCAACCVDDLSVLPIEAERIRHNHAGLLRDGEPHPAGACAFLDDQGSCRIYADRPYVCRTQGLPLRWFEAADDGEVAEPSGGTAEPSGGTAEPSVVERRDICPLNDTGPPLEELSDEDCWLLGPAEARLEELAEASASEGASTLRERVALRSLFRSSGEP